MDGSKSCRKSAKCDINILEKFAKNMFKNTYMHCKQRALLNSTMLHAYYNGHIVYTVAYV